MLLNQLSQPEEPGRYGDQLESAYDRMGTTDAAPRESVTKRKPAKPPAYERRWSRLIMLKIAPSGRDLGDVVAYPAGFARGTGGSWVLCRRFTHQNYIQ